MGLPVSSDVAVGELSLVWEVCALVWFVAAGGVLSVPPHPARATNTTNPDVTIGTLRMTPSQKPAVTYNT